MQPGTFELRIFWAPDVSEIFILWCPQRKHESIEAYIEEKWRSGITLQNTFCDGEKLSPFVVECDGGQRIVIDVAEEIKKEVRNMMIFQRCFDEFVIDFTECIAKI